MRTLQLVMCLLLIGLGAGVALAWTEKSGNVGGESWGPGTYWISANLSVSNDTLRIQPGEIIKFADSVELHMYRTLMAEGTPADSIIFTSMHDDSFGEVIPGSTGNPAPGDWDGILNHGNFAQFGIAHYNHCRVSCGGAAATSAYTNLSWVQATSGSFKDSVSSYSGRHGIMLNNSNIVVENSLIHANAQHGLMQELFGDPVITGTIFTGNGQHAVHLPGISTTSNWSGNSGSGNGVNSFGFSGQISVDATLTPNSPSFPYVLVGGITVGIGVNLELAPSCVLKAGSGHTILVNGSLQALGLPGQEVVITSLHDDAYGGDTQGDGNTVPPAPGDWPGIHLNGGSPYLGLGEFNHCRIRHGGAIGSSPDANL